MCAGFSLEKNLNSFSIDVRITMISGVVYLLRIFKMFLGLMNNPVYSKVSVVACFTVLCQYLHRAKKTTMSIRLVVSGQQN